MSAITVSLGEICEVNPRMTQQINDNDDVVFLPMAAVSEDGHILNQEIRNFASAKKGYNYFERGDVLLAKITPCFENGKATRTSDLRKPIGFSSTEFHVLRPKPTLDENYLFHFFWNERFRASAIKEMTGSAGQKRLPKSFLSRVKIPLPPLEEQRRIAAILDKADALRRSANKLSRYSTV